MIKVGLFVGEGECDMMLYLSLFVEFFMLRVRRGWVRNVRQSVSEDIYMVCGVVIVLWLDLGECNGMNRENGENNEYNNY